MSRRTGRRIRRQPRVRYRHDCRRTDRPGVLPARHGAHRPHVHGAAGPPGAGRRADRGVRPRGGRRRPARGGATCRGWCSCRAAPGSAAPRPVGRESWLDRALDDYRVLLLDQRGTGRSTPANRHTLAAARRRPGPGRLPGAVPGRLDRRGRRADPPASCTGGEPWSVLGQSFGGFCTVSYLSFAPEGIREALITGGLPGLDATADDVYRPPIRSWPSGTSAHYERYPQDADRARGIARHLAGHEVLLPDGGQLTVRGVPGLGPDARPEHGQRRAALPAGGRVRRRGGCPTPSWPEVAAELSFAAGPLYALLHEACYAQGDGDPVGGAAGPGRVPRVRPGRGGGRGRTAAVHRRDDLPLDVRAATRCCARCARPPRLLAAARRLAAALRPGPAGGQRGARRRGGLLRGHVRAARRCRCPPPARSAACGPG